MSYATGAFAGAALPNQAGRWVVSDQPSQPVSILLAEDDETTRNLMVNYLEGNNMHVVPASGRQEVKRQLCTREPNLMILDLHLGQENGLDLLREIRSDSDVPVIITTGNPGNEMDRVVSLELGADDCMIKPFGLRELLARIRAVLRRHSVRQVGAQRDSARAQRDAARARSRFGGWQLDRRLRRLTDPNGKMTPLTKGEYALLIAFLDAPQRPLTREHLLQATHVHEDVFDRSVDVQVLRLRHKLEADPRTPHMIRTERGVGYIFALPVETL